MIPDTRTDLATPDLFDNFNTFNSFDHFDDFAAAAKDPKIACPLTQTLTQLAEQTQRKLAKADEIITQVETHLEHAPQVLTTLDDWKNSEIKFFVDSVVQTLQEGRQISINSEFVFQALYGPRYPENHWDRNSPKFYSEFFTVWNPAKLIEARDCQFGNLEEAEKKELFRKIARYLCRAKDDEVSPKQIPFYLHFFREESYEKGVIRHYYNAQDYHQAFNHFQRLIHQLATGRPLHECSATVPLVFNNRGPFTGAELYRWHDFSVHGIIRFRFYKSGKFIVELASAELKERFLKALATYSAEAE